ncbi:PREDICTED: mediator of RNA polymerase II transcription subunit 15-like [Atta cephalotes]|uniref:DRBM domain-containing protein n=1 Tax=Atta cephalotes TaxID=12957 RepID=A0A158NP43_ATTCE|nr:PREDICTED: mediator of RNA polymerase II transcription subunit 15-like [Atta cephalotes]
MYTRSRQSQNYGNGRNTNNPQGQGGQGNQGSQGSYPMPQQQQQQQQPTQMAAAASTRPVPTIAPTQQLKQLQKPPPQLQQQQGQQQKLQMQQQQQQQQQQKLQQQQQQAPPQQIVMQQQSQQQQQAPNPLPLPQRLKPILKHTTVGAQSTVGQTAAPQPLIAPNASNNNSETDDKPENMDVDMQDAQPRWRRKIPGCKLVKVNKKLKRLRMNQRLRKTLQPKNAIMVLNEMKAGVQFTFPETQGPMPNSLYLVHAELDGKTYVGQGLSKPLARQNAAENALKALLLEKMTAASMKARLDAESDGQTTNTSMDEIKEENNDDSITMDTNSEDEIPWSSLASFALYKLFLEWHNQGTSVPVPRPGLPNAKGIKKESPNPKTSTQKELPPNPTNIHPVMLLNQMRPGLTYTELSRVGNPPNTMFTLAVEICGIEYSGTAKNKKDAKKAAAKAALLALYNLTYPEDVSKQDLMAIG